MFSICTHSIFKEPTRGLKFSKSLFFTETRSNLTPTKNEERIIMARKSNDHRKAPPTQHSSFSCANTSISSINESPESKIPSNIRLQNTECTNNSDVDVTAVADGDNSSDSNSDEESINAFRDSVFDYPEWVTLVDLNDAGGDENVIIAQNPLQKSGRKDVGNVTFTIRFSLVVTQQK